MSLLVLLWFGCAAKDPELLFRAAAEGDAARVEALLTDGARRDAPVDHGLTPLIIAAYAGREEAVRVLLAHGADPNVPNEDLEAPLHTSAAHAAADRIVPMLLASGADVGARDKWGRTPLAVQAQEGRGGAVDALLAAGADPNARDHEGTTSLLLAAENGHEGVVAALLARGADPRAVNQTGADALSAAAAHGYVAIVRRLLDAGAVVGAKFDEHDAIGVAITNQQGSPELLAALYGAGPYERVVGPMGSGLHVAARAGDRGAVDWLLARGVPVDARHEGLTPLMLAAVTGKAEVARALVSAGADPRADYSGASILHLAAAYGDPAGVALVLEWGPDVNVLNGTGGTPLRSAAEQGHAEVARMLLSRGADSSVVDVFGKRAIDYAREGGHDQVVALLGER